MQGQNDINIVRPRGRGGGRSGTEKEGLKGGVALTFDG